MLLLVIFLNSWILLQLFPIFLSYKAVIFVIITVLFQDLGHHFFHFLIWKEISEHLMIWIFKNCKGVHVIHTVRGINRYKWYLTKNLFHKVGSKICYVESHEWEILKIKGKGNKSTIIQSVPVMCCILHVISHLIFIKSFPRRILTFLLYVFGKTEAQRV